jgi:hypothetical protein
MDLLSVGLVVPVILHQFHQVVVEDEVGDDLVVK